MPSALSFVAKTTPAGGLDTNITISVPSGVADGDILLMHFSANSATPTAPGGWTLIDSHTSGVNNYVWYRIASSEPANYTITHSFAWRAAAMIAYRSSTVAAILVGTPAKQTNSSSTNIDFPSATATNNSKLLCFGVTTNGNASGSTSPHSGMTERWELDAASLLTLYMMDETISSAGSTGTRTATISSALTSSTISVTIGEDDPNPPDADPDNLTATAVSSSQINLAWDDNSSNEDGFEVERSPNGSTSWTLITTTAANASSYNNTGLSEATTYYYRVRGVNSGGYSGYTSNASALTFPAAPSGLTATPYDDTRNDLSWTDNSAGETGQKVERSANGTTGWTLIYTAAANATSYSNTGLSPGATWYYRIGAYNASGTSYSNVDSATTAPAPQLVYDIGYRVSFDWDRDGTYTNETDYLISAKGSQRVAPPSQSITANQGQVAQCSVVLDNSTGRFSSLNSGGALYSYIGEGKAYQVPIDVEMSNVPAGDSPAFFSVFQGYARIPSEATLAPGQAKTITFDCRSKEDILMNKKLRTSQTSFKVYRDNGVTEAEFIADLVAEAAPDLVLEADDGLVMLPWAYLENESVLETIWQLCAATGGRFYGSADGTVNYENAAHWLYDPHDTSQYSYTRGSGFQSLELSWNDTEIAEEASVSWAEKEIAQPDVIYDSDRIVVPAGETVTIYGDFNAPAYEITGIVTTAGTNGGVDLSSDIAVTPTYYAQSVKLVIVSTSAVQANVRVKVSGKIAEDTDSQTVSNTSGDSFWTDRVGRTRKVTGNRWVQSEGQANMLLDFIRNRQVLPTLIAKMKGCPGVAYRKIGDRVTITDSEINLNSTAFWVTAINWTYSSRGYWQDLECVRCSDLYPYESTTPGYFIWGTSKWGSSDPARGRLFF